MGQPHGNTQLGQILAGSSAKQRIAIKKIVNSLFYNGAHSTLELSKITGFSIPTVSALLENLIYNNIVEVCGQRHSNGGRKPQQFGLKPQTGCFVAVYLDQYYTQLAMLDLRCQHITEPKVIAFNLYERHNSTEDLTGYISEFIISTGITSEKILGVGVGMPGLVDVKEGFNEVFFKDAENGIRAHLSKVLGLPVVIQNDSNVLALGEHKFGCAKGLQNVLVVNASWGVGLGMVLNGELFHGHSGYAGEFSHIPINENGVLCSCGKQGCLETECSATTLARLAKQGIREGKLSSLSNMRNEELEKLEAELVIEAANKGDQYSVQILSQIGYNLGKGLACLIHLLNPELIVVSGRLAKANKYILTPIEQSLNKYSIPRMRQCTRLAISTLCKEAAFMGCASLVVEHLFGHQSEKYLTPLPTNQDELIRTN